MIVTVSHGALVQHLNLKSCGIPRSESLSNGSLSHGYDNVLSVSETLYSNSDLKRQLDTLDRDLIWVKWGLSATSTDQ